MEKITYDDTRDISIRCIDKLIALKILPQDEHNFEIQDLIQDEINKVLGLDIDDNFEITIIDTDVILDVLIKTQAVKIDTDTILDVLKTK